MEVSSPLIVKIRAYDAQLKDMKKTHSEKKDKNEQNQEHTKVKANMPSKGPPKVVQI